MTERTRPTHRAVATALLLLLLGVHAEGAPLDPRSAHHPLLDPIGDTLHSWGFHHIRNSHLPFDPGDRPQVRDLAGFGFTSYAEAWREEFWVGKFTKEFEQGRAGVLSAIKPTRGDSKVEHSQQEFERAWRNTPSERRVFISFTSADHEYAKRLQVALRQAGYVTFLYLNEEGQQKYSPGEVGRFFQEAQHRLVIDTPEARRSPGIHHEAWAARELWIARHRAFIQASKESADFAQRYPELFRGSPSLDLKPGRNASWREQFLWHWKHAARWMPKR